MHDTRLEAGVPYDQIYAPIMLVLAGMMVVGFVANMLIKPLDDKAFMTDAALAAVRSASHEKSSTKTVVTAATEKHAFVMLLAWGAVLIPIAYGIWSTAQKAWSLFS
jgi:hypothetical protein